MQIDRNIHIYCYGESHSTEMAHQAEEHEHGDFEVGAIRCGSTLKAPYHLRQQLTIFPHRKQSNLSTTKLPRSMAPFESDPYTQVRAGSGKLADLRS
jgi:hypothetical protein